MYPWAMMKRPLHIYVFVGAMLMELYIYVVAMIKDMSYDEGYGL